ncbi:hypothetical protein PRK78_003986 [Emydomyces testavorans]|uniref:Uncharacterized protein n=1 Tax=Emydomyces testavorans TaxID=2070801 RepID=A0AAF0DHT4_9EURO|nr:hypothetical protein PRK78_003986 [Emydomyces testavorans]
MIRRKPTVITITSEDILAFEEARLLRQQEQLQLQHQQQQQQQEQQSGSKSSENKAGAVDPNDELKPLPGDKARIIRSRDERIGGLNSSKTDGFESG